ncbi:MAG: hypothetical protein JHC95_15395 [Solirubrobacteraceae bacterium]|nr:hypothetical protein [Solirubrobacteraceae bacterium]
MATTTRPVPKLPFRLPPPPPHWKRWVAGTFALLCVVVLVGGLGGNWQVPGRSADGLPNCGTLRPRAIIGSFGAPDPQPPRAMRETFATPPAGTWCSSNVGHGETTFGPEGVTLQTPRTRNGVVPTRAALFPYHRAGVTAKPAFTLGMTAAMRVGPLDLDGFGGSAGWGVSNGSLDPRAAEMAWFMVNRSGGPVGFLGQQFGSPGFHLLGEDFPRGFFIMAKDAGIDVPQVKLLDESLLGRGHSYAIELGEEQVEFYVDGEPVGVFDSPPKGTAHDLATGDLPLLGQFWLDRGFWLPLPIPQLANREHELTMSEYRQGPADRTPRILR